jgi:hypothetical protein
MRLAMDASLDVVPNPHAAEPPVKRTTLSSGDFRYGSVDENA